MGAVDDARVAKTEALFREVNERVAERAEEFHSESAEFICECGDATCIERVAASLDEYEKVRERGDTFLIATGHEERPDQEQVIARADGVEVVRKLRELGAIVRRMNPRSSPAQ